VAVLRLYAAASWLRNDCTILAERGERITQLQYLLQLSLRTSMRRHCLSRPTWRPRRGRAQQLGPSRYASIRTLVELTFFWWLGA
jgi:hypothetical protein